MKIKNGRVFFGALANKIRYQILKELESGEKCVNDLVNSLKIKQSLVSHNLKILIKANLVQVRRSGTFRYYSVNKTVAAGIFRLQALWESFSDGGAKQAGQKIDLPGVSVDQALLFFKLDQKGVVEFEYGTGFEATGFDPGTQTGRHFSEDLSDMPEVVEAIQDGLGGKMLNRIVSGRGFIFGLRTLPLKNENGQPDGCIGMVYDVTDKLQLRQELRVAEGRWKAVMDCVPHQAALVDASGRIIYLNRPPSRVPMEKAIGMSIFEWFAKPEQKLMKEAMEFVVKTGEMKRQELTSSGAMDGRPTKYKGILAPIYNNGATPNEILIMFGSSDEGICPRS